MRRAVPNPMSRNVKTARSVVAFPSQLGWMAIAARGDIVCRLTFGHASKSAAYHALEEALMENAVRSTGDSSLVERLQAYAKGHRDEFRDVRVDLDLFSPFRRRILECCRRIPFGTTVSYAVLATKAGFPRAGRAVGNCMAANRVPLIIPCHRVVRADGQLGHYSAPGGPDTKRRLLELEFSNAGGVCKVKAV